MSETRWNLLAMYAGLALSGSAWVWAIMLAR